VNANVRARQNEPGTRGSTALFLGSDDSSYITGTDIVVDGDWVSAAPYLGNERANHMLVKCKGWRAFSVDAPVRPQGILPRERSVATV
jgi:hypothetical protein